MQEIYNRLRELQDVLSDKIAIENDINESPKLLTNQEEVLSRLKRTFIEKNAELEAVQESIRELRVQLSEAEMTREKAEKNMDNISTQREYEALEKEIRDSSDKEQLYRKELQKVEREVQVLDEEQKRDAALIAQQEAELAEKKAGIEQKISERKKELVGLEEREKSIGEGIDEEILFKFERIIRSKLGVGIVSIKGGVCTGCHMILPAEFANQVRAMESVIFCPYCSRILFYDDSQVSESDFFDDDSAGSLSDLDFGDTDEEDDDDSSDDDESGDEDGMGFED
jgi:predicted  nucleic acid-binding Zn-ribbon protein